MEFKRDELKQIKLYGCSSIGRVAVSKTVGWEFESLHPCKAKNGWKRLKIIF